MDVETLSISQILLSPRQLQLVVPLITLNYDYTTIVVLMCCTCLSVHRKIGLTGGVLVSVFHKQG